MPDDRWAQGTHKPLVTGSVPNAMPPATVVRIAVLFLGGAFCPLADVSPAVAIAARLVPLTSAVEGYRTALSLAPPTASFVLDLTAQLVFGMLFLRVAGAVIASKGR